MPSIGLKKVADYVNSMKGTTFDAKNMYSKVVAWAAGGAKHPKGTLPNRRFNVDVINTLVDAIVYEPTNKKVVNPYEAGNGPMS